MDKMAWSQDKTKVLRKASLRELYAEARGDLEQTVAPARQEMATSSDPAACLRPNSLQAVADHVMKT